MNKKLIKDNYYQAVNGAWIEAAEIPGDQPSISAFYELHLGIEETLMDLVAKWEKDSSKLNNNLKKFLKFYQMTKDYDKRNDLGSEPFNVVKEKLEALTTLKDLADNFKDFTLKDIETPFGFFVMQDFMDSNNQILYFGGASLILPDTTHYQDEKTKEQLLGLYQASTESLLNLYGYTKEETVKLINDTIAFDALLVPVTKSSVEAADRIKMYNPYDRKEVELLSREINLMELSDQLVNTEVDKLIVLNKKFIEAFNEIFTEDNFELIKSWMIVKNAISFSGSLSNDLRIAGGAFRRALSGIKEAQNTKKASFYEAYNRFNQVVGLYYGENFFGPIAKKDVEVMTHEMIGIYEERIKDNSWLQEETKKKAIEKLDTLTVHVGYPEELPPQYDKFSITSYDEGSNVLLEKLKMNEIVNKITFNKYNKEPNKNIWGMPASMVNAYYSPSNNQIVFPAAILQKPYYSIDQSPSANYGGIGAVMAHEISHAFDNNGAKFDETGSLNNWWTEADLKAFKEKSEDMIKLFDGLETGNGKCNGELTVSENIADSGGLRCALEASKKNAKHDLEEFFKNWAKVWRIKASKQYSELLLKVDVHGPAILRANMQLSNLEEFQDFYNIKKEDKMYLAKDKMVSIW